MAEVLLGRRAGPGGFAKPVAIKRLLPEIAREEELRAMFVEEARLQAGLAHRNLVQVFDFGEDGGDQFLVMEYVDGTDLGALLARERRLAPATALQVAVEVAEGLDYLHGRGIVHRDVSPGNVYLSRAGEVKLGDFGIAKGRAQTLRTERGRLKGKLAYLAPEQARGDAVDARADVYALGLLLFEMLSGARYLWGESEADLLRSAMEPTPRPAGAGDSIDALVARLLLPRREDRLPSARLASQAIHQAQATLAPVPAAAIAALVEGASPPQESAVALAAMRQGTERLGPRVSRRWPWIGAAALLLAGALAVAFRPRPPIQVPVGRQPTPQRAFVPVPPPEPTPAPPSTLPTATPKGSRPPRHAAPAAVATPHPDASPAPPPVPPAPPPPPPPLDRAAIERRIADLDARLEKARLDEPRKERARRFVQQALSDTMEQRYAEAARQLDALEALLGP
jgi:eukaryotic-like serine/threonine-protein kinase